MSEESLSTPASTGPVRSPAAPPRRPRRRWPWVVAALILVVAAVVFYTRRPPAEGQAPPGQAGRGKPGGPGSGPPRLVISTAAAQKGSINVYVSALGVVTPLNTVSVRSRVDGQLVKVNYTEGQLVHAGDPLVEIDPAPYQAALAQAEGQLARDTAQLENARLDVERYKEAFSRNAIPKQLFDTQVSAVHQYEGAVKLDQGQLENARVQLAYCHIAAPITGRVGLRLVDAGNIVRANDANPLVIIAQLEPITVIFSVAEDHLPQIQPQLRAHKQLVVDAFDRTQQKKLATGTLQTLDNQIDPTTGTIKLKAIFTNENEVLFPSQFVNARLLVDTHVGVTLVPNPAIQRNAQGAFVYVVQAVDTNQVVAVNPVTVGTTDGTISEVDGLKPGAIVALDNFNRLTDGARVMTRPAEGEGRPRGAPTGPAGPRKGGSR